MISRTIASLRPHARHARHFSAVKLPADSNQAQGIGQYAKDLLDGKFGDNVDASVYERVEMFHTDSVMCGISALALKTNAPTILREEALTYSDPKGATVFGSSARCAPEKVIAANASAVREWDSNGTVFGFNPSIPGHDAGEFGHNDFYPVVMAAAQVTGQVDGKKALLAMIALDEIRGRLAEVFSLKSYKIDHVVHGAIASAAVYGALMGATVEQIESAIGMAVAHYIPFRAIRAGKQLSDSKGASAAISTEAAVLSVRRAMRGFVGPKDIFRNPEAIFRFFEPTTGTGKSKDNIDITLGNKVRWGPGPSPFNLILSHSGDDFAVMGMHFKLGLYEHQSAGALEGLITALVNNPELVSGGVDGIAGINIIAYEPAFGIIGDPAKKDPKTRQSADHSMAFIVSRILQKALKTGKVPGTMDEAWMELMLSPYDYGKDALYEKDTRSLMDKITFSHGGPEYDAKYPDGIPTAIDITLKSGKVINSGMVMYPSGHARNTTADLKQILQHKNRLLGDIVFPDRSTVDQFVFPCKYASAGCEVNLPHTEKPEHEESCEFRPYSCPCPGASCKWQGSLDSVMPHLMHAHKSITTLQGEDIVFLATDINLPGAVDWVMMQSCFGHHFMLVLEKQEKIEGLQQFYAIVQLIGTRKQAENFVYRLELNGNRRRLAWEATPRSIHEGIASAILNSDCLVFDTNIAHLFADNGNLGINVTISMVS